MTASRHRSGFTLVELLMVMVLFGALAAISTSGYYAVVRGIEERGAIAGATSVARAAQQRARIDRVKTALFLYNELVTPESSAEDSVVQGVAIAVRIGGRISLVLNNYLCDEFADLNEIYGVANDNDPTDTSSAKNSFGMRLYQWPKGTASTELKHSTVGSSVVLCEDIQIGTDDLVVKSSRGSHNERFPMWAFYIQNKGDAEWRNGDAYAIEFASMRLPKGYFFGVGSSPAVPTVASDPVKPVKVCFFDPDATGDGLEDASNIQIYTMRPDKNGVPKPASIGKVQEDAKDI